MSAAVRRVRLHGIPCALCCLPAEWMDITPDGGVDVWHPAVVVRGVLTRRPPCRPNIAARDVAPPQARRAA